MGQPAKATSVFIGGLTVAVIAMVATAVFYWPRPFVDELSGWSWFDSGLHAMYATLIVITSGCTAMSVSGIKGRVYGMNSRDPWKSASRVGDMCFYTAISFSFWIAWQGFDGVNTVFVLGLAVGLLHSSKRIRMRVFQLLSDHEENHELNNQNEGPRSFMMAQPSNQEGSNGDTDRAG